MKLLGSAKKDVDQDKGGEYKLRYHLKEVNKSLTVSNCFKPVKKWNIKKLKNC